MVLADIKVPPSPPSFPPPNPASRPTATSLTDAFSGVIQSIKESGRFIFILAAGLQQGSRVQTPAVRSLGCTTATLAG